MGAGATKSDSGVNSRFHPKVPDNWGLYDSGQRGYATQHSSHSVAMLVVARGKVSELGKYSND